MPTELPVARGYGTAMAVRANELWALIEDSGPRSRLMTLQGLPGLELASGSALTYSPAFVTHIIQMGGLTKASTHLELSLTTPRQCRSFFCGLTVLVCVLNASSRLLSVRAACGPLCLLRTPSVSSLNGHI